LIDTATALIAEHGAQGFTVEQLLEISHISKGSLYHHFADFSDVITQSQTGRFATYVAEDIELLTTVMVNTTSREDLLERLEQVARAAHGPDRAKRRIDRAAIISSSQYSETGRAALAATQQLLTDAMSDLVRELQERKLIDAAVDPQAFATFVQAYSLGLVLNDVTENPVDQEVWIALIGRMLRGLI
jgi:AcrR family transcriptional regulator